MFDVVVAVVVVYEPALDPYVGVVNDPFWQELRLVAQHRADAHCVPLLPWACGEDFRAGDGRESGRASVLCLDGYQWRIEVRSVAETEEDARWGAAADDFLGCC